MIIAIDGHDGVGKTCLAKSLCKDYGYNYVKCAGKGLLGTTEEQYDALQNSVITYGNSVHIAWFLAMSDMFALSHYKNKNVILDRSALLNYYWNYNQKTKPIFDLSHTYYGAPDLVILLTATKQTRQKRLQARNINDKDLTNKKIMNASNGKLRNYLRDYGVNYVELKTDNLTEQQVKQKVVKILQQKNILK